MPGPIVAVGDLLRVRVGTFQGAQAGFNIRYSRISAVDGDSADLGQIALEYAQNINNAYKALMTEHAEFIGVGITLLTGPGAPDSLEFADTTLRGPGAVTGDPLPKQCCGLVKLNSDESGRKGRGRMYVAFPSEDQSDVGQKPDTQYQINLASLAVWFVGSFTVGVGPNTASLQHIVTVTAAGAQGPDLTNFVVRDSWATQRRRGSLGAQNKVPFVQ